MSLLAILSGPCPSLAFRNDGPVATAADGRIHGPGTATTDASNDGPAAAAAAAATDSGTGMMGQFRAAAAANGRNHGRATATTDVPVMMGQPQQQHVPRLMGQPHKHQIPGMMDKSQPQQKQMSGTHYGGDDIPGMPTTIESSTPTPPQPSQQPVQYPPTC